MTTTNSAAAAFAGGAAPSPSPAPESSAPAPSPSPAASPSAAPAPSPAPAGGGEWYSGIADESTRTWVAAKGWKDPGALAESAYNLEKLIGHEKAGRTVVIPGDDAKPEEIAAYRAKIGVPESAADYKLPVPEGTPPEFANEASKWFHEAGIPPKQAQALTARWNEFSAATQKAQDQAFVTKADQDFTKVVGDWGQEADANLEAGRRAAREFVPAATPDERAGLMQKIERAVGTETMLKMFAAIGKGLGEHRAVGGEGGGFGAMTQAAAQQKIAELKSDKAWTASYIAGDKAKSAEFQRLFEIAYPEQRQ
ncbi:hypothetical protein [Paraburkholderia fungorum]|uniref:hypothetical protein n=1 Tax=Paraburkholderia fungorum TaxID=134537 RepID=UPI001C1EC605|nr:hypothetical protein [Paraburkholderia fungorum]MBU7436512.1 hypothetical protein [Paraburkholderia fungorum]